MRTPAFQSMRPLDATVIVPLYQTEHRNFGPLQGSVMAAMQGPDAPRLEIVLVVNDINQENLARNTPNVHKWAILSHNTGVSAAWNIGATLAEGEILVYLNDDVVPSPDTIQRMVRTLRERPDVGIVGVEGHDFKWVGMPPQGEMPNPACFVHVKAWGAPKYNEVPAAGVETMVVTGHCFAIRHADLLAIGKFDETFSPAWCEEYDACFKVREILKKKVLTIPGNCLHEIGVSKMERRGLPYLTGWVNLREHFAWSNMVMHQRHFGKTV